MATSKKKKALETTTAAGDFDVRAEYAMLREQDEKLRGLPELDRLHPAMTSRVLMQTNRVTLRLLMIALKNSLNV